MQNTPAPVIKKRSRFRWLLYITFWTALVVSFGYVAITQAGLYSQLQNDLLRVEEETDRALLAHEALQRQIEFVGSDAYIEQQARERLGLVKPTEIIFVNIGQ